LRNVYRIYSVIYPFVTLPEILKTKHKEIGDVFEKVKIKHQMYLAHIVSYLQKGNKEVEIPSFIYKWKNFEDDG
jgi:hypothetical protein